MSVPSEEAMRKACWKLSQHPSLRTEFTPELHGHLPGVVVLADEIDGNMLRARRVSQAIKDARRYYGVPLNDLAEFELPNTPDDKLRDTLLAAGFHPHDIARMLALITDAGLVLSEES